MARYYKNAADAGNLEAMYNLGVCYANGLGVEKSLSSADGWYRKAAEKGQADAMNNLGISYEYGNGVEQDFSKAAFWYKQGVQGGNAIAMFNLGRYYGLGNGVQEDHALSMQLFQQSAAANFAPAKEMIAQIQQAQTSELFNHLVSAFATSVLNELSGGGHNEGDNGDQTRRYNDDFPRKKDPWEQEADRRRRVEENAQREDASKVSQQESQDRYDRLRQNSHFDPKTDGSSVGVQ
jgi:hypothetical protein